jgi:glycosyltransferase involved in cell wall biosynthesis
MEASPSISVVLPVYNGERYLRECLDSVLAQSFADYELIAVDDGSKDGSLELLRSCADPRLRMVRNESRLGIFGNLNRGCQLARGPLLQILCQDDRLAPDCLAQQRQGFAQHPSAALVWCRFRDIDERGQVLRDTPPVYHGLLPTPMSSREALAGFTVFGCMPGNLSPVMLRREALLECGGFRGDLTYAGDFECWVRLVRRHPAVYSGEPLLDVRTHPARASHMLNRRLELIGEEAPVWRGLLEGIADRRRRDLARRMLARCRGVQYLDWSLRLAARGELGTSLGGLRELGRTFGLARTVACCVSSLNGRRPAPDRAALYRDLCAPEA